MIRKDLLEEPFYPLSVKELLQRDTRESAYLQGIIAGMLLHKTTFGIKQRDIKNHLLFLQTLNTIGLSYMTCGWMYIIQLPEIDLYENLDEVERSLVMIFNCILYNNSQGKSSISLQHKNVCPFCYEIVILLGYKVDNDTVSWR